MQRRLVEVAAARSGDKGDVLDISLLAPDAYTFGILSQQVTAGRVREFFAPWATGTVERYDLPRLLALKFVVQGALDGGAARSLRIDNLGKTLGAALLRLTITWPDEPDGDTRRVGDGARS